ncbi:alpha-amylase family glycosyl hydrolase [Paenibacillus sp. FSL R5-0407]|uniref:alpha-amylase family glycosyl hydrolase n=1 Tax=Paenibacillus sp. FSL R5-0407 TaxID=2975320 RepID=UPI0030FB2BE8
MHKSWKGWISRLLIFVLVVGSFGSFLTQARAEEPVEGSSSTVIASPVIANRTATGADVTFNYEGKGQENKVIVKGEFNGWNNTDLSKDSENLWSGTLDIPAGWYEYGMAWYPSEDPNGEWIGDPWNLVKKGNNPGLSVPGLAVKVPSEILLNKSSVIDAVYYTGNQGDTVPAVVTLKTGLKGVEFNDNTNEISVAADADQGNIELDIAYDQWKVTKTIRITDKALQSPVISDGKITFNVAQGNLSSVFLVGSLNGWNQNEAIPMELKNGVFSVTLDLAPGAYQYKFIPNLGSWAGDFIDTLNPLSAGGNSLAIVPGLVINSGEEVEIGGSLQLKAEEYQTGKEAPVTQQPKWDLVTPPTGFTISDAGLLTVAPNAAKGSVEVKASYNGLETTKTIQIVEKMNSFTINYYRYDGTANDWNLWLWPDGSNGTGNKFTSNENGIAKGTYKYTQSSVNVITRLSKPGNDWAAEGPKLKIAVPEGKTEVEVWLVEDIPTVYYEKPDFEAIKPSSRSIQFTYISDETDPSELKKWNIWTWYTVKSDGENKFTKFDGNKATAIIPIGSSVEKIGFKMRKGGVAGDWSTVEKIDQDYDREIYTGSEALTKVIVTAGQGPFRILPGTAAPVLENGKATFTYRDQALYENNAMDQIVSVHLKIDGQLYKMDYNAEDERFTYTLDQLTEGTFEYTYVVKMLDGTENEITDPKNTIDGKSRIVYKVIHPDIQTTTVPERISYNENAVLNLSLSQIADDEISSISADLTVLGGNAITVIDKELKSISIAVKHSVTTGLKQIPVTVVDVYGNKHTENAQVTVKPRQTVGKDDFDWDEARIYFMLTDRFLNGDTANDDPNGENYDLSHAETYHGGDFKGVTEKIGYLKDLGINTIWITPIVDNIDFNKGVDFNSNQYAYHGYWAKDFTEIDEHLGDLKDFQNLLDAAHAQGIKVMVDVVLNHTGYGMDQLSPNWSGLSNLPTETEREVFAGMLRDSDEDPVIKNRVASLPDFKTEDPAVREQIIKWQSDWIEKSKTASGNTIDYFRVDTIKHVENTTWMAFKNRMTEINPAFKMIGENFGASVDNDGGFLRTGTMDSELDFGFKGIATDFVKGQIESVERKLQDRNGKIDNTAMLGQFLSSHDENGFMVSLLSEADRQKFKDGTLDAEVLRNLQAQHKIAASLQITAKGQPVIYYGEEVGQSGMNAGNMENGQFSENRYDFNWEGLNDPTYSHIYEHYKKMLRIRDNYSKIFSKGTRVQIGGSDQVGYDVFTRTYQGKSVVVGINTKTTAQQITFTVPGYKNTKWVDQYSNQTVQADSDSKVTLTLPSSLDGGTIVLAAASSTVTPPGSSNPGSGSGSSAPGAGNPTPAVSEYVNVTAKAGENGRKVAEVSAADLEKAIAAATNGNKPVTIQISGVAAGEAAELVIPGSAVGKALEQKAALQLVFPDVTVEFPAGSIPATAIQKDGTVVFSKEAGSTPTVGGAYRPVGGTYNFNFSSVDAGKKASAIQLAAKVKVTLTLDETALKGIGDKNKAGVYAVNEDGSVVYVGGKWDGNRITFSTDRFAQYIVMEYNKTFSDVTGGWAKNYIEILAAKHIASGVDAERFNPKGEVTRGEFAAFLGRAMGLDVAGLSSGMSDVAENSYYAGYVAALSELGIVSGYEDGTFRPSQTITREQMATLLMKAYAQVTGQSANEAAGAEEAFSDLGKASAYAVDSIKAAKALGIMNGMGQNKFEPAATSTREQVAAVLILFMEKAGL